MNRPDRIGVSDPKPSGRDALLAAMESSPIPRDDRLSNIGLFNRSVMVAKTLYLDELYRRILPIPGVIVEFGTWWCSNMVTLASLRSIHEPYNRRRIIVGFDTFDGYRSSGPEDGQEAQCMEGSYSTSDSVEYLTAVLRAHEEDNVQSHIPRFQLIKGDIRETASAYFTDHASTVVALAYFDVAFYGPTKSALTATLPHLIPGSILAFDDYGSVEFPGETKAIREVLHGIDVEISRSQYLPDRTIMKVL